MLYYNLKNQYGIATLPTIMALSILVLGMAVGLGTLALNEAVNATDQNKSDQAYVYAQNGAEDALRKIAVDKTYSCASTDCYSLNMVSNGCTNLTGCATVQVSGGVGSVGDPKVVTVKGKVENVIRILQLSVVFDGNSFGTLTTTTWVEQ